MRVELLVAPSLMVSFISSSVSPMRGPEDLNSTRTQSTPSRENALFQPHTNSRATMAGFYVHMDALAGLLIEDEVVATRG
jgi:hypothetical protein